ncbi:MAG: glycosyltransferase, partial [Candidimonas sp.]
APRMLCVATVVPRKGHLVLVEALSQIADLAWYCVCVGDTRRDPAHADAVRAAIRRRGLATRVQLAGIISLEALRNAYRRAWLFVLPSYYEGYGMTIAEALTYGLPVVTTTGGALGETLPRDAGVGVPPGDASALARALRRLLCDAEGRASMSAGARRAVNALASWDEAGRRFAAALDRRAAP